MCMCVYSEHTENHCAEHCSRSFHRDSFDPHRHFKVVITISPPFTGEMQAQSGEVSCPRSHSSQLVEPGCEPRLPGS